MYFYIFFYPHFKTGSHDTLHIIKNYFATVFSIFNFFLLQISKQTLKFHLYLWKGMLNFLLRYTWMNYISTLSNISDEDPLFI